MILIVEVLQAGDTKAIAAVVNELLKNPVLRRQMGQAALVLSQSERFSPPAAHQGFADQYAGIIGNG